jgi:uncharacterized protein
VIDLADAPAGDAPVVHPDAAAFWNAVARGEFRLQQCLDCATMRFPVAPVCWNCLSPDWELTAVDPAGTVDASIIVERVTSGSVWARHVPYRTGLITLAGGLRVPGRILCDCGAAARPGTPVTMCRIPALGGTAVWAFRHSCREPAGRPVAPSSGGGSAATASQ